MKERIEKVVGNLDKYNVDAILITNLTSIRYLLGFSCTWGVLILCKRRKGVFFTDGRYYNRARGGVKGVSVRLIGKDWLTDVSGWVGRTGIKRIGFEANHLSFGIYSKFRKKVEKGIRIVPMEDMVEKIRQIKDKREKEKIRKAIRITEDILWRVKGYILPGRSEWQIRNFIERLFVEFGVEPSFPPIVAVGKNSANPHPVVSKRRIVKRPGQVLIDLGVRSDGYSSDLTRTFWVGRITRTFRQVYQAVLMAQEQGLQRLCAGNICSEVDGYVRRYLGKEGLAGYFMHGLGHGVGLEVHEMPRISRNSKDHLRAGMVVTVEPGVYIPGWGGVRIEDMVFVKEEGIELLSRFPRKLEEMIIQER